jgi:hypothetical protein
MQLAKVQNTFFDVAALTIVIVHLHFILISKYKSGLY